MGDVIQFKIKRKDVEEAGVAWVRLWVSWWSLLIWWRWWDDAR